MLPPSPRTGWGWYLASAAVNVVVLAILVWLGSRPSRVQPLPGFLFFTQSPEEPVVNMVYLVPRGTPGGETGTPGRDDQLRPMDPNAVAELLPRAPRIEVPEPDTGPVVVTPPTEAPLTLAEILPEPDSQAGPPTIGTRRRLGPAYGDGRVWAPIELTNQERAIISFAVAEIDSALREQLIARIRDLPPDSFAMASGPRAWTTEIGGQTFGIDGKFIRLGPLKVPTMLLALLPLNLPDANIFDAREKRAYERVRQDIIRQAQRQADTKQIREYIKEMRKRADEARERRRALKGRPDSVIAARDTIIP